MLAFDVDEHSYRYNGTLVPNVTRVLAQQFPLNIPPQRLEFARVLGKAIHKACEFNDRGTLDVEALDNRIVPYLTAWRSFLTDTGFEIIAIEQQVYHPLLRYAGTLDRVGRLADEVAVLDLKRPVLDDRVGIQLAGYQKAYNDQHKTRERATARYGLQLRDDSTYRLRRYRDEMDWSVFISALNIYNWRATHDV